MNAKGFTLIELIIIIVVLGVLAVSAIPIYYNMVDDARTSAEKGVVGNVRGAVMLYYANSAIGGGTPAFPATLDAELDGTPASEANPLFVNVIVGGVTEGWTKTDSTHYVGPTTDSYVYSAVTGTFLKE